MAVTTFKQRLPLLLILTVSLLIAGCAGKPASQSQPVQSNSATGQSGDDNEYVEAAEAATPVVPDPINGSTTRQC